MQKKFAVSFTEKRKKRPESTAGTKYSRVLLMAFHSNVDPSLHFV